MLLEDRSIISRHERNSFKKKSQGSGLRYRRENKRTGEARVFSVLYCEPSGGCQIGFSLGKHSDSLEQSLLFLLKLCGLPCVWEGEKVHQSKQLVSPWVLKAMDGNFPQVLSVPWRRISRKGSQQTLCRGWTWPQEGSTHTHLHGVTAPDCSASHLSLHFFFLPGTPVGACVWRGVAAP